MENEHIDTIRKWEIEEYDFIKSSVENLVQNPSESEDFSDIKSEYDMPVCDNFRNLSNLLMQTTISPLVTTSHFLPDEDVPNEIYSNHSFLIEEISFCKDWMRRSFYEMIIFSIILLFSYNSYPVDDSDSLREDIDIFPGPGPGRLYTTGIDSDDFDYIPVDVPNILPTHPALHMDFDFIPSINDLGSDLMISLPTEIETRFTIGEYA
ncbi:hypothetical protein Tco_0038298 [Tanacetum coccineum]